MVTAKFEKVQKNSWSLPFIASLSIFLLLAFKVELENESNTVGLVTYFAMSLLNCFFK